MKQKIKRYCLPVVPGDLHGADTTAFARHACTQCFREPGDESRRAGRCQICEHCADSGSKWRHQHKMAVYRYRIWYILASFLYSWRKWRCVFHLYMQSMATAILIDTPGWLAQHVSGCWNSVQSRGLPVSRQVKGSTVDFLFFFLDSLWQCLFWIDLFNVKVVYLTTPLQ